MTKDHGRLAAAAGESRRPGNRLVTPAWYKARKKEVAALRESRETSPKADTALLIPAAQHPLIDGRLPGPEFEKRLASALERYQEITGKGGKAEFLLPGSRHRDSGSKQADKVALYDAAGAWLVDSGVQPAALHGKDWIDLYKPEGVYSGAAEISVAAAVFSDNERFRGAEYFSSPGQVARAEVYALAHVLPLTITVPESLISSDAQFHSDPLQKLVFGSLAKTIDPYGDGTLARLTQDRIPQDGNTGTVPELLHTYGDLPWYGA